MTDKEAICSLCLVHERLSNPFTKELVLRSIRALNFKLEIERFAEEYPESFDIKCRQLLEQLHEEGC